ncbi:MAG: hypothetical protein C0502_05910 [Opitutus sp.]|nr:hypothetical protein [Opitutus sp.]
MRSLLRTGLLGVLPGLLLVTPERLRAQVALVVQHEGKPQLVRMVKRGYGLIEVDGKKVEISRGAPLALVPVSQFRPVFVKVRDFRINNWALEVSSSEVGTMRMNKSIEFRGTFESPVDLENVFAAVEFEEKDAKRIFYQEIGTLKPGQPKRVAVRVPLAKEVGRARAHLHVFADGSELLHSRQWPGDRDGRMRKMISQRMEGVKDAPVRLFVAPTPDYPEMLREKKINGEATVRLRVSPRGEVREVTLRSASDPVFGEAALAAARLAWFFPRVQGGKAVETEVDLPFKFEPPLTEVE